MAPNRMTNASQQRCYFQETVVNEHLKISNCAKFYIEFSKNVQETLFNFKQIYRY